MKVLKYVLILVIFQTISAQTILQPALSNSNKMLDSIYIYKQLPDQNEYLYSILRNQSFDEDKNPTSDIFEQFDENADLIRKTKTTYSYYPYDEYLRESLASLLPINQYTREILNLNTNTWLFESNRTYIKNEKFSFPEIGTSLNRELYFFDDDYDIDYGLKGNTTLNGDFPIDYLKYSWNSTTNTFEQSYKYLFVNTITNGDLSTRITNKISDFATNEAVTYKKEEYLDIGADPNYQRTTYSWDGTSWQNWRLKTVSYDNGKITETISYQWDNAINNWEETRKSIYTYNIDGNLQNFQLFRNQNIWYDDTFTYDTDNLLTDRVLIRHDYETGDLIYTKRYVCYYSPEDNLGVNNVNFVTISLHPNPAKTILNIEYNKPFKYQIYSIQGVKVLQGTADGVIDIKKLNKGVYFIYMEFKNTNLSKKFIVGK